MIDFNLPSWRKSPFPLSKTVTAALLATTLLVLPGCMAEHRAPKHKVPLSSKTLALMSDKGMRKHDPIVVRIFKEESQLEVWKRDQSGRYAFMKSYDICAWSGVLGPKKKEGDRQAPEGFYAITPGLMNPNSSYYLSFNIGYPNQFDKAHNRTGSHLMVHGACSSRGCYSMTDEQMGEIYGLAREAFKGGQRSFQVQAYPFRMTPENLARHRNNPNMRFWKRLKEGSDHFEVTGLPPEVGICGRDYVFNATPANPNQKMRPTAACPKLEVSEDIQLAVAEKQTRDEAATQLAVAELLSKPAEAAQPKAPEVMLATGPEDESGAPQTIASSVPVHVPGAPPVETASAEPAATPQAQESSSSVGSFFSRVVAKADPRGWVGDDSEASAPVPASTNVPLPSPRPERTAMAGRTLVAGYAPVRGISANDGDPFAVFDLFTRVGKASWAPKDYMAIHRGNR